ncbi:hypothetical protein Tco_0837795, partial [Tanacetum coccineum]
MKCRKVKPEFEDSSSPRHPSEESSRRSHSFQFWPLPFDPLDEVFAPIRCCHVCWEMWSKIMNETASTPIETQKPLTKDEGGADVDVHLYRSMIGSLMYLTTSRPDIMFAVCNCSRFQVTPKTSHLNAVKRIFRRLVSWQCKKQTIVATSTTEAEYVAAASCCGQVLWIQNQMLDYGFNFMNTKIHIDNESTICIVKNPVFYSKTKHIKIRHHFIRDAFEKKLIQVLKIHTDNNVAGLLTKAFDGRQPDELHSLYEISVYGQNLEVVMNFIKLERLYKEISR